MAYRSMVRTCNVRNSDMAAILPMMFVAGLNIAVLFLTITTMLKTVNAKRSHTRIARFLVITSFWLILTQTLGSRLHHQQSTLQIICKRLTIKRLSKYTFFKKPRIRGSDSAFLNILEFESQKFLMLMKISVFSFLRFLRFEPPIFLKFCVKNSIRTGPKYLLFGKKKLDILYQTLIKLVTTENFALFSLKLS